MANLLLQNIHILNSDATDLRIDDGKITELGQNLPVPEGTQVLDAGGMLALPGAIDMHVHFRTPGGEHKETLLTGSDAAVKGGVTTVADMPNTSPPTTTLERLEQKVSLAQGAKANMLYNFGADSSNLEEVRKAAKREDVRAIKIYVGPSTGVGGLAPDAVEAHFRQAAELNLPVIVHAEDMDIITANAPRYPHDVHHHTDLRALEAELRAVEQVLQLAKIYPIQLYVAHTTSAGVIERVEQSGLEERVMVEVCPHHLVLSTEDIQSPIENRFKVNPPVRRPAEQIALLEALGRVGCLGSDHAPHTLQEKEAPYDQAPSGMPGVEYLLPFALTWWAEGKIDSHQLVELTSTRAAKFFGMNKGKLEPGFDADIVLVDTKKVWRVGEGIDHITSKCGWSPYVGREMRGLPVVTIVGGREVYRAPI